MIILMSNPDYLDSSPLVSVKHADRLATLATLRTIGLTVEYFPDFVNRTLRPHSVDVVLFTCVLSGHGVHHMGDQSLAVEPGTVGVTLYGQDHDLLCDSPGADVINLYLDLQEHPLPVLPSPWEQMLSSMLTPHSGLVYEHNRRVHLVFEEPQRMAQPLQWMLREQTEAAPGYEAVMLQLLVLFLVECCRAAEQSGWSTSVNTSRDDPDWLEKVRVFIDESYNRPIGLADLTQLADISAEHLCRRFRQYTGQSPIAYLTSRRLQAAMWMLRTTRRSVTEIAYECGFSEPSFFNRKFREQVGLTPTVYRKLG